MLASVCCAPRARRKAFTMVEVAISAILLAAAMTMTVHVLRWILTERRSVERRQCAIEETANLMEQLSALPWERLTPESARASKLSDQARQRLPSAQLEVDVADRNPAEGSKRISIRLRWQNRAGMWDAPVRLTSWAHRRKASP